MSSHPAALRWFALATCLALLFLPAFAPPALSAPIPTPAPLPAQTFPAQALHAQVVPDASTYRVLAWNDLGMHCYNRDFQDLAVLPPFNTLWAQVVRVADPPEIVTGHITVSYFFADNTESASKSNFWQYDQALFGVDLPLNIGLTGRGLSGEMDLNGDHFEAVGIPLTEFRDSDPTHPYPYQIATIIVRDETSGVELARTQAVAPVSTEMHCDNCHSDGGVEDISTGRVGTNILTLHDEENLDEYPAGHRTPLMQRRPVLCAECHSSNALGAPGVAGLPSLSRAMHEKHADKIPQTTAGCYNCHPGPTTKCLRDTMSAKGMTCVDCHGTMEKVAENPSPWMTEPRCDGCHDDGNYNQNKALYRMSSGHGGIYCAACHDSPHAIAPSSEGNDSIKFLALQGHPGPIDVCTVCHASTPTGDGPHRLTVQPPSAWIYLPAVER